VPTSALPVPITALYAGLLALLHAVGLGKSAGASWQRAAGTVGTIVVIVVLAAVDVVAFRG